MGTGQGDASCLSSSPVFLSLFFFLDMCMWTDVHLLKYDRQGRAPIKRVGPHFRLVEGIFIS